MDTKNKKVRLLLDFYKEISLLGKINALLGYDTNVSLPPKGVEGRAEQTAHITKLISEKWLDPKFRALLDSVKNVTSLTPEEKAIVRNLTWAGKYYFQVPQKTVVEFSRITSHAFSAWHKARTDNNFKFYLPHLKNIISVSREIAGHLGYKDNPYDALLDMYEPELTVQKFQMVVDKLQPELTGLVEKIANSGRSNLAEPKSDYDIKTQEELAKFVLTTMGYDFEAGRQDVSPHPFTETLGTQDVRITNRYKNDAFIEPIMVAMHEGGHALYEQGVNPKYEYTPLSGGVSLGIHESQSRFWENQVGRSKEFISFLTPFIKSHFPQLKNISADELYKIFNIVKPGQIRVEADEVTYNLHIFLRFEIENALINGKLKPENLPEIWNSKMEKYLGVTPDCDANGVLQDVHWAYGNFGYFPTYTLGNLYAAQFTATLSKKLDVKKLCAKGELTPILIWLRQHIHTYGSLYFPEELCKKVTGETLDVNYFVTYLHEKYRTLYSI
ncbi:carboxypeptidase M32 [Candidatus Woesebacteria bacterium]|nr:MAG: carboxypeptidase M32 [Candidatus Woesebacteria bacterium]